MATRNVWMRMDLVGGSARIVSPWGAESMFKLRIGDATVAINAPDSGNLLEEVRQRVRMQAGFAIATLNLDHIVKLRRTASFRAAYARQDLVTADGQPIVWLSRLSRRPVQLVTGSDLVEPLAALAAEENIPIALVGATPETLAAAAETLRAQNPRLRVVARLAPGRGFDAYGAEATEIIEALRTSGARLAFLALGAPRQELFAARCREALPGMGFASVGAGLDFIARSQRRAPAWVRRLAIEWLWRVASDPRRLAGRYARCVVELPRLAFDTLSDAWLARQGDQVASVQLGLGPTDATGAAHP
jgi:N-acetylglucosaminyldiphosphoundecaprenol N-acetyl-beta-D-mannosaminyltransferase